MILTELSPGNKLSIDAHLPADLRLCVLNTLVSGLLNKTNQETKNQAINMLVAKQAKEESFDCEFGWMGVRQFHELIATFFRRPVHQDLRINCIHFGDGCL